jgi:hypothetical protein
MRPGFKKWAGEGRGKKKREIYPMIRLYGGERGAGGRRVRRKAAGVGDEDDSPPPHATRINYI